MKKLAAITLTSMMLLLATTMVVGAVDNVEVRGKVASAGETWTAQNFAGFYYDIDKNIGTEELTTTITDGKFTEPDGVKYSTKAEAKEFDFDAWGQFNVIGFLAEKYFAGYVLDADTTKSVDDQILLAKSTDENSLVEEQLQKILMDDDSEQTVTSGTPLKLEEGYELAIKSIDVDGNKVFVELNKDGAVVDSKVISPSKSDTPTMADKTYYYKKSVGDQKDLVIIGVHFKNAFRGADQNLATVDGIWQISDSATSVKVDDEYGKMRVATVTAEGITMDNKDNSITLSKNKDITLYENVGFKTADQDDVTAENPLRYTIYKKITEPGTYEIRGVVDNAGSEWTAQNFAGFYYDIDKNIGTETLTTVITDGKLNEPDGVKYSTKAEAKEFDFDAWGQFNVIGFLAEKYFAGYVLDADTTKSVDDQILLAKSTDENSLVEEQLQKILMDDDSEQTVTSGTPLKLEEGYELAIKSIDVDGNKVFVELNKDGAVVDSKVISPSKSDTPTMADKTYYYKKSVGDQKDLVIIGVHFKNAFRGADQNLATVDGIWQISDSATSVKVDDEYGKMRVATVTAEGITMDNKDNSITLSKNKQIELMEGVKIKTADQDDVTAENPLRYYIYKDVTIEGAAGANRTVEAAPVVEAAPAATTVVEAAKENVTEAEAVKTAATENVAEAKAVETAAKENVTEAKEAEKKATPGFESIIAITGLLAVAFLVLGRKE